VAKTKNKFPPTVPSPPMNNPEQQDADDLAVAGDSAPDPRVERAIDNLRRTWLAGHDSLTKHPSYARGRKSGKAEELAKLGVSGETLRKARRLARNCSFEELEDCITAAREAKYAIYPSSLTSIYEIASKPARLSVWKMALQQHLSHREILVVARARKLTPAVRQAGSGRPVKMLTDPAAALQWLREQSNLWLSIAAAAEGVVELPPAKLRVFQHAKRGLATFLKSIN